MIQLPEGEMTHSLVFVRWYKKPDDKRNQFHCQIDGNLKIYNIELWNKSFYDLGRDCIIPIHSILGQFVAGNIKFSKKNPREYLSVIPINQKIYM